jgi:hypothetical protein
MLVHIENYQPQARELNYARINRERKRAFLPAPVYVAEFEDGTVARQSVYHEAGKPYDFDRSRSAVALLWCRSDALPAPVGKPIKDRIVNGWIEHDIPGQPWVRIQDPAFGSNYQGIEPAKPKRVTAKAVLRELVQALTNPSITPDQLKPIFEQAKALAA